MLKSLNIACIFKMVKEHRSEVRRDIFIRWSHDDIGLAGNSDEVIYPTLIPAKISGVPFAVYRPIQEAERRKPRLISHVIIFKVFQPVTRIPNRHRQRDGRTDKLPLQYRALLIA